MTILKWLVILAVLGYVGAVAALFFNQRSLIYPIPEAARTTPAAAGFAQAEEHLLTTSDGEQIIAWHVSAKAGHRVVLYFHGNGDILAGLVGRFREITSDGTGLIAVSYRGYAGSSGSPSELGLLQDAAAAYNFALAHYAASRIVPWGFSLGSGVAVALAADHPVGGLILEAPYTSIADVAATLFRWAPVRYLLKDRFRSDEWIARVNAPLLVMHGDRDLTISISFGERLFALAHEPKQFVRFPGGGHNDLDQFGAIEAARKFIAGLRT
ncbi:alpha/beta hydrolase [Bradyrhizobium sp. STM 3562]|uniref:alpha/beta hydrolase n=1 Tax=Bradyrhizobium sp. STM 3562 TaxID=578924 RepID=UPI00388D84FA